MKIQEFVDEISTEITYLNVTIDSINQLNAIIGNSEPDIFQKAAINQFISEFYNGIENILKRICKYNNFRIPYGEDSHIKLFNLFVTGGSSTLPIIFIPEIVNEFKQIRKFRHFIIHGYSFKIEWSYIKESVTKIDSVYKIIRQKVINYLESLN